jgi:hypothetical protein
MPENCTFSQILADESNDKTGQAYALAPALKCGRDIFGRQLGASRYRWTEGRTVTVFSSRRRKEGISLTMRGRLGACPKYEGHSFALARDLVLNELVAILVCYGVHSSRGQC